MGSPNVVLGIDLGSTSTRAAIYVGAPVESLFFVQNVRHHPRVPFGDFPSTCYPFDDGPAYVGVKPDLKRESISMKYGFYLLAGASDDLLSQYDLLNPLLRFRDDAKFRNQIKSAIDSLLTDIWSQVQIMCRPKNWEVNAISLAIPSQWTLEFEEVYRDLASKAFGISPEKIIFVTEAGALAQFIIHNHTLILQPELKDSNSDSRYMLLLDFGGHNMNSCILAMSSVDMESPSFFLGDKPKAAGGGAEQWEFYMFNACIELVQRVLDPGRVLTQSERQRLLNDFHTSIPDLMHSEAIKEYAWDFRTLDGKELVACLPANVVERYFLRALRNPEALARLQIKAAAKLSEGTARGTSRSQFFKRKIIDMCNEAGLKDPEFIESWGSMYFHARVAEGAVYAVAHPLSVESFIARGAGFGLQMRQGSTRRSRRLWDNSANFMLADGHGSETISQKLNGLDELKIICNPFFTPGPDSLEYGKCYDFMGLGRPKRGFWTFAISFYKSEGQTRLRMKANWRKKEGDAQYQQINESFSLYVDHGSKTLHPGHPGQDQDEVTSQLQASLRSVK
ncbi:hypothetical protein F4680DRAFT_471408 [Xylaria scruposa]|nr:hypothetical protein F4680DRAFT_471408 [Xylaria scruposa]